MNSTSRHTKSAIIAGAGISGLATAWWLNEIGWRVTVVERAPDLRSGGWMLGLSDPGLETVRRMGLYEKLEALSHISREKIFYGRGGKEIFRLNFDNLVGETRYLLLNRNEIVEAEFEAVKDRIEVRFATTVLNARQNAEKVLVSLSDGTSAEADLLIGADGVRSQMRTKFFGPEKDFLEPLGYQFAAYEGRNILGLSDDSAFFLAPKHFAEFYPLSHSTLAALQVWPSADTTQVPPEKRWPLLREMAARGHTTIADVIATADTATVPVLDHLAMVKMPSWHRDRILLTGDAAHCLTFISGQGAGMALASALVLSESLAAHGIDEGLQAHERRLRPAIVRLQDHSRQRARGLIPGSEFAYFARNAIMYFMRNRKGLFGKFLEAERLATESLLPASA